MADKFGPGIIQGSVDATVPLWLRTADSTPVTSLTYSTATACYWRQGAALTTLTLVSLANSGSAHADGGWCWVHTANAPGLYRLDLPDAAVASGADWIVVVAKGPSVSIMEWIEYPLVGATVSQIYAQIKAEAASLALAAYDPPTKAEMDALAASAALAAYDAPTKAEMDAVAASLALAAYDPPTKAEMDALAASTALTAYDAPTKAEMDAGLAALNDITVAEIWAQVIDGLDAETALKWILAYASGKITKSSTAYAYSDYGASNTLYTLVISDADRTRT